MSGHVRNDIHYISVKNERRSFVSDVPRENQSRWMQPLLHSVKNFLAQASSGSGGFQDPFGPALPRLTDLTVTPFALQCSCDGLDIDLMVTFDWETEMGGTEALYTASCAPTTSGGRQWFADKPGFKDIQMRSAFSRLL